MLCLSKRIHEEARESFFQRPLICASQSNFINRVHQLTTVVLKGMDELSIQFEDMQTRSLTAQLDSHAIQQRRLGTNNPFSAELQNVCQALRKLPNIRTLTVEGPLLGRGFAPPVGYLNQLLNFTNLRSLSFSGFSIAEPDKIQSNIATASFP